MDANVRGRIVPDADHDPSDLDWPADEIAEHLWLFDSGQLAG